MKKIIYLFVAALLIQGCKKENPDNVQSELLGKFALGLTSNLKSAKLSKSEDPANFVLDTLKSSRSFYFILGNVGKNDIKNIFLSTDNSSFKVTPSTIQLLPGTENKQSATLVQIISLDVIHGTRINGVGYAGLLNLGDNFCNITIKGQTSDGESTVTATLIAKIKVYAKVMAVALYEGSQEYDLTKPISKIIGGPFDISQMNYYYYSGKLPVTLKNTGNVNITMKLAAIDANNTIVQNSIILPKKNLVLNFSTPTAAYGGFSEIQLSSDGTIFDQQKLSLGNDGNAYFSMTNNSGTIIPPPPSDSIKNK